jgi:UTP--glucose-1-phosphate uridylyltransferase
MIVNKKTVDPSDDGSPEVFQLETAMGAALGVIEGARVLSVPRTRFAPVKTTDDLLVLRSDAYVLTDDFQVVVNPEREDGAPFVELDPKFFKRLRGFDDRFPEGAPSLMAAERLVVEGDVRFGRDVVVRGRAEIKHAGEDQLVIDDGTVLEG